MSTLHAPRVLFLDEPTAGVDVRNRGLFWEVIQEEAQAGVTVFVTTHFLEEVAYCDWVCFIDAGRVIADDTPENLRRRYGGRTRVDVDLPPEMRARAAERLGTLEGAATPTATGWVLELDALDPPAFATLRALADVCPQARVRIAEVSMADVFRQVLTAGGQA